MIVIGKVVVYELARVPIMTTEYIPRVLAADIERIPVVPDIVTNYGRGVVSY